MFERSKSEPYVIRFKSPQNGITKCLDNIRGEITFDNKEIYVNKVPASPSGKSIKSVEVMVRIASDNHNQK